MSQRPVRRGLDVVVSNWRHSHLPFFTRIGVALRNYGRRLALPPKDCCGHPGEPGC